MSGASTPSLRRATSGNLLSPKTPVADSTLKLQLQQFLDDYFYRVMQSTLGKCWSRKKALVAALELFQLNGVQLTQEDIEWCSQNDDLMNPLLVRKMPYSVRENFESLTTQLNLLIHTATRVRSSVEQEGGDGIEQIMQEQDTGAIKEQILKQAVIQASKEVADTLQCQDTWVRSMEKRLLRLSRSAELAESAQQQLLKVETQLDGFHEKVSDKSKKALMGFAESGTRNLLHSTFSNWGGVTIKFKNERLFRKKFEQEMIDKEMMLMKLRERSMQNVKNVLMRKSRDNDESCMYTFFHWWREEVGSEQREEEEKKQLEELEKQMQEFTESKANAAKKVMARVGEANDEAMACMAFAAWAKGVGELKADKEIFLEAKKIEQQLANFREKQRTKSAKVMEKMGNATNSSLIQNACQGWATYTREQKKSRDLENTLMGAEGRFKMLNGRQKGNAAKVQTRVNEQIKQNLQLKVLSAWQCEAKMNHIEKYFSGKMEGKRKQLQSVQTLFKSFAKQLEGGLGKMEDGDSSGRTHRVSKEKRPGHSGQDRSGHSGHHSGHRDRGGENSVSLPDIHSRR